MRWSERIASPSGLIPVLRGLGQECTCWFIYSWTKASSCPGTQPHSSETLSAFPMWSDGSKDSREADRFTPFRNYDFQRWRFPTRDDENRPLQRCP